MILREDGRTSKSRCLVHWILPNLWSCIVHLLVVFYSVLVASDKASNIMSVGRMTLGGDHEVRTVHIVMCVVGWLF